MHESALQLCVCMNEHTRAPWCLFRLILGPNKTSGHAQTILSLWIKSIFIHTGSWKLLCEHTCPQKCEGRIYVIVKVGGGGVTFNHAGLPRAPCDLRPCTEEGSPDCWANHWYNPPHSPRTVFIQSEKKICKNHSWPLTSSTLLWTVTVWSYRALSTRTTRHRNSFFPRAIYLMNTWQ